jgi:hypothetical protein
MAGDRAARCTGLVIALLTGVGCKGGNQADGGRDASATLDTNTTEIASSDKGPGTDASVATPIDAQVGSDAAADVPPAGTDASAPTAAICPSLTGGALTDVVVTARIGRDLVHLRRNGERTTIASFDWEPLSRWLVREKEFLLADGSWVQPDGTTMPKPTYQAIMVDRAGVEHWRYTRRLSSSSDRSGIWPDERGGATLSFVDYDANTSRAVVVLPDGTIHELDGFPLAAVDAQGWAPFALDPLSQAPWGFIRAMTGERIASRLPLARSDLPRLVRSGRLVYLGVDAGQVSAVIETRDGAKPQSLGTVNVADVGVTATDAGAVFTVNGRPRWLALAETDAIVEVGPYPDVVQDPLSLLVEGDWALVHDGLKPLWIVHLRTGQVRRAPALPDSSYYMIASQWAFGIGRGGGYATWRLNLATGEGATLDYSTTPPFRVFDSSACVGYTTPAPLDDGRLPSALRDDQVAGIFVGQPSGEPWQRIGRLVTGVDMITPRREGDAWVLTAIRNIRLSCKTPWEAPPTSGEQPLVGDSLQIVSSAGGTPIVFQANLQASPPVRLPSEQDTIFHPSGKCVFVRSGVYDVPTGQKFDLAPADLVAWW